MSYLVEHFAVFWSRGDVLLEILSDRQTQTHTCWAVHLGDLHLVLVCFLGEEFVSRQGLVTILDHFSKTCVAFGQGTLPTIPT